MLDSPTNQIFVKLDKGSASKLMQEYGLELWEDNNDYQIVRIVISFTTKKEDVDELISFAKTNILSK